MLSPAIDRERVGRPRLRARRPRTRRPATPRPARVRASVKRTRSAAPTDVPDPQRSPGTAGRPPGPRAKPGRPRLPPRGGQIGQRQPHQHEVEGHDRDRAAPANRTPRSTARSGTPDRPRPAAPVGTPSHRTHHSGMDPHSDGLDVGASPGRLSTRHREHRQVSASPRRRGTIPSSSSSGATAIRCRSTAVASSFTSSGTT